MIRKIIRRLLLECKLVVLRLLIKVKKITPEESIIISSDPRGGSTWLSEIINSIPNSVVYWEPLNLDCNRYLRELHFSWRQHIPFDEEWPEAKSAFDRILSLKVINNWTTQKIEVRSFMKSRFRIIKFCRANNLILWLVNQYDFKFKPILLLRHPFSVVLSQMKHGGWTSTKNRFRFVDSPFNERIASHKNFLQDLTSREEVLVANWCLANYDVLIKNEKVLKIHYEDILLNPDRFIHEVFEEWNLNIPDKIWENIESVSSTNVDYVKNNHEKQLGKWKNEFTVHQIENMQNILDYFGVTTYSKNSVFPQ